MSKFKKQSGADSKKDENAEIIKGLLKWIKAQDIEWGSDLDIIFKPEFNPDDFKPVKR